MPTNIRLIALFAFTLLLTLAGSVRVEAQTVWNATLGDWNDPANWNPASVPLIGTEARIGNNATAQLSAAGAAVNVYVDGPSNSTLQILSGGNLTLPGFSGSAGLIVGRFANGTLTIASGGALTSNGTIIGDNISSRGNVTMTGGLWNETGQITVGSSGQGVLNVDGGVLNAESTFNLGFATSGNGTVNVRGGTLNATGSTIIGRNGVGLLNLESGTVNLAGVNVGTISATSNGTV